MADKKVLLHDSTGDNCYPIVKADTFNDVLPIDKGGTGKTTLSDILDLLGITNIGSIFKVNYVGFSYTISANGNVSHDLSFITVPTGYTLLGFVGYATNAATVMCRSLRYNGNLSYAYSVELRNVGSSSISNTFEARALFVRSEFAS